MTESSLQGRLLNTGQGAQVPMKDGAGGRQGSGDTVQGRDSVQDSEDQRKSRNRKRGTCRSRALTPSVRQVSPAPRPVS